MAPERIWKLGRGFGPPEKIFWSWFSTFLSLKVQLVVLVSAFVMVGTVWSVSCLLFFYSRCPLRPAICKSGEEGRVPRPLWSRRRCPSPYLLCNPGQFCWIYLAVWKFSAFVAKATKDGFPIENAYFFQCGVQYTLAVNHVFNTWPMQFT